MKKERLIILSGTALIVLLILMPQGKTEVDTSLEVVYGNVAPSQTATIPNQTWAMNTNLTNAFDLDDYFYDNETLNYTASSPQNITVTVNETTHIVSFYPNYNFQGLRGVVFTASDGQYLTDSNNVTLNVTQDTKAPRWSNLAKDKEQIFQNSIVTFSANWQDDVALGKYVFSISQESGWVNQSQVTFGGIENTSTYPQQISAPAGTVVSWRFYGYDASNNVNATAISNFTVGFPGGGSSQSSDEEDEETTTSKEDTEEKEELKSSFIITPEEGFKVDILQGSTTTITIKITNNGQTNLKFEITTEGLENFGIAISESNFTLAPGESKTVTIEFTADKRLSPDIYYGKIKVKSQSEKEIPIVIIVKPLDSIIDLELNIPEEYKLIRPGSLVKANITLKNLGDIEEKGINLYYAITDYEGVILDTTQESFTFFSASVTLEKNLTIPENTKKGEYIFFARAVSEDGITLDSDVFEVGEKFNVGAFLKANFLFVIIILSALAVSFLMIRMHKTRERVRLLNLYLKITEINKLIKEGKTDEAIGIYSRIKTQYGESVSETTIKNKEELKKEIEILMQKLNIKVVEKKDDEALDQNKVAENKEEIKKEAQSEKNEQKEEAKNEPVEKITRKKVEEVNKKVEEEKIQDKKDQGQKDNWKEKNKALSKKNIKKKTKREGRK